MIARTLGAAGALTWLVAGVDAAEVVFPKDKPVVSMFVPDGWTVSYTPFGLEIESPEKNLYVIADLQQRRKDEAETWAKKALVKVQAFGVSFGRGAKPTLQPKLVASPSAPSVLPPPSASASAEAAKPAVAAPTMPPEPARPVVAAASPPAPAPASTAPDQAKAPDLPKVEHPAQTAVAPAEPTTQSVSTPAAKAPIDPGAPFFTLLASPKPPGGALPTAEPEEDPTPVFSGHPSLATPGKPDIVLGVESDAPQGQTLEEMTRPTAIALPSIPFRVGRYPAATWKDQPIDVQIVNFGLSSKQLFLVIQASLTTDDRAVALIKSVKRVTATP